MPLRICARCRKREMLIRITEKILCNKCRRQDEQIRLRRMRRKNKVCIRCGENRDSELLTCSECRKKYNKTARKNHKIRKERKNV